MTSLTPRQQHLIGVLRRADEPWLQLWELAQRAGYSSKVTAANVRELRRRQLVATRPCWYALSATEVSLRGPRCAAGRRPLLLISAESPEILRDRGR